MVIKSSAAWEGHIGSKAHRLAVSELRKREQAEQARAETGEKRKATPMEENEIDDSTSQNVAKRARTEEASEVPTTSSTAIGLLPVGFFSDPSAAPVLPSADDSEDDENATLHAVPSSAPAVESQLDLEWEQFQSSLASTNAPGAVGEAEDARRETFERATIFAEAEVSAISTDGIPSDLAPTIANNAATGRNGDSQAETEEEKRLRKQQEDRELIMDRLIEEVS